MSVMEVLKMEEPKTHELMIRFAEFDEWAEQLQKAVECLDEADCRCNRLNEARRIAGLVVESIDGRSVDCIRADYRYALEAFGRVLRQSRRLEVFIDDAFMYQADGGVK